MSDSPATAPHAPASKHGGGVRTEVAPSKWLCSHSANEQLRCMAGEADARRAAADLYVEASEHLLKSLPRYLHDEDDLIMPVILDRGEVSLFSR